MIIITGASKGIGKYLFDKFYSEGVTVYGSYFSTTPETTKLPYYTKVNVNNIKEVENWIASINDHLQDIVLINCAGTNYNSYAHKSNPEEWYNVINTNLIGAYNVIRVVLPKMRQNNYGRIINFSSVVAQIGTPGASAYAASKSGLWGLSKSIAVENATKGITVNNLNLGYFDLGMTNDIPLRYKEHIKTRIPTGSFGDPTSIYNAVTFLIHSEEVNGISIDISAAII